MYEEVTKTINDVEARSSVLSTFDPLIYLDESFAIPKIDREKETNRIKSLLHAMVDHGATFSELEEVIKHHIVVHETKAFPLDWKQSEKDNKIEEKIRKYTGLEG